MARPLELQRTVGLNSRSNARRDKTCSKKAGTNQTNPPQKKCYHPGGATRGDPPAGLKAPCGPMRGCFTLGLHPTWGSLWRRPMHHWGCTLGAPLGLHIWGPHGGLHLRDCTLGAPPAGLHPCRGCSLGLHPWSSIYQLCGFTSGVDGVAVHFTTFHKSWIQATCHAHVCAGM